MCIRDSPRTAISYNTYGDFVFAVEKNDEGDLVVNRRTITAGPTRDKRIAVLSGLKAGERVVSRGLLRLRAGQKVTVQDENKDEEKQPQEASE
ncbi:MAG TPA: efflux transporter periplasmic adaptor subunit, partial [Marinobacter sp.]|nr:efflux transporter periplasmic adaptor subunit [Marinobacter sp.]